MKTRYRLPPVGNRIIKSAVGVLLCWCVYLLRGRSGIPFYSMLAVLWCIQPHINKTLSMALQRTIGTLIGAVFGLVTIVLEIFVFDIYDQPLGFLIVALMIIPVIYTTIIIRHTNASYFSCVVFLSITVNHIMDENPYIFVLNRVLDTFIGIAIGMLVNSARLPRRRIKDVLFTAELDDMLSPISEQITAFSRIEINRMLSEGLKFTLVTMRTPASLMGILSDVNLNLPVVVMNGAALYDFRENSYVKAYIISGESCEKVREMVHAEGMNVFTNALCDESLVIYYDRLENEAERAIFASLKKSPYRNYLNRSPHPEDRVIYLMIVDRTEKISRLYEKLRQSETGKLLKMITYPSQDYHGFSYIKIYNRNAGKQHMTEMLCREYGIEKRQAVEASGSRSINGIARRLKSSFEPLVISKKKTERS
ncbi:MAG: HAD hydrolase family protein [Oscillospiraceae bacterium]|nr:HAD hydrolase family protein [Oscillospiraceae bacterium]